LKEEQVEEMKAAIQRGFEGVAKDGFEAEVKSTTNPHTTVLNLGYDRWSKPSCIR
jgi:uncharacterized protein YukE